MHTPTDKSMNHTEILQHRIQFWLCDADEQTAPQSLDDASVEHIKKLISEGYREGELCVLGDDGDTEFRGWWGIAPAGDAAQRPRTARECQWSPAAGSGHTLSGNAGKVAVEAHTRHLGIEGDLQCQVAHLLVSLRTFCNESGVSIDTAVADARDILRG